MFVRFFAAATVVDCRSGTVCAFALLLTAVFLCSRRWYTTVLEGGCGGRRAASPFWRPLCAQAAAFRSLPTRCRTVRGPSVAAAWFYPRCVQYQNRSAGAVCSSSAGCADARWASVTITFCERPPVRVCGRRALGPSQRLHHERLGPRSHPTAVTTAKPASSVRASPRVTAPADAAAHPIPSTPGSPGQKAGTVPAGKPAPPRPVPFRLAAAAAAAPEPASSSPRFPRAAARTLSAAKPALLRPASPRLPAGPVSAAEPAPSRPSLFRLAAAAAETAKPASSRTASPSSVADARVAAEPYSHISAVTRLAATGEPKSGKRNPSPVPAVTFGSGELRSSWHISVLLAAAPGAAATGGRRGTVGAAGACPQSA